MHRIKVTGLPGGGVLRLTWGDDGTVIELTLANTDEGRAAVLLDHPAAVRIMAGLGAFIAGSQPSDEISATDRHGHQNAAMVHLGHDSARTVLLRITNRTDATSVAVRLDQRAATTVMAQLGAYVATS